MNDPIEHPRRRVAHLWRLETQQDIGPDAPQGEHLVATVTFDLEWDGVWYRDLKTGVKQTAGSNFEADPLEVMLPAGVGDNLNYARFRDCVEAYYREALGAHGLGIQVEGDATVLIGKLTYELRPYVCDLGDPPPNS